jgi:NAD(P)-dependent dehydrogenase (short-subunit alcohol dehydrogenase family)
MPDVTAETLDLMDPVSIDAFAERFVGSGQALHILVNNAGIMANPLTRDARGYESQFSTNHLGHFQLTARLWPALRRAEGARVVSLSSVGHRRAPVDFEDPNFERREYDRWVAYGQSKTANALFAVNLDTIGEPHGIRAFSVHPGGVVTDLIRYVSTEEVRAYGVLDQHGRPVIDRAT